MEKNGTRSHGTEHNCLDNAYYSEGTFPRRVMEQVLRHLPRTEISIEKKVKDTFLISEQLQLYTQVAKGIQRAPAHHSSVSPTGNIFHFLPHI